MRLGLGAKFTLTVLIILAGTNAASTLYDLSASLRFHEEQLVERGRALGRLISLVSPEAILGFDFLALNNYTREVSEQPDIVYSVITSPEGTVLSSHIDGSEPLVKKYLGGTGSSDALKVLQNLSGEDELINLRFPISHEGRLLGHFLVGLSRGAVQSEFRRQLTTKLLVLAAVVLFLSLAIWAVFRLNVLHPIQRLIAASENVGRGQHAIVEVKSADEMGLLATAFNAMAEGIKREQAQLHRQANFDTLTDLPNRLMAFDRINMEISRAKRSGQRFAVLFVDLDDFKSVNDSLGHAAGDQLLVAIAARLQAAMRDADTVARLGGDEFLVLASDVTSEMEVEKITERVLESVAAPQEVSGRKLVARCSVGIALYPDNGEAAETLVANADNAMYQAKTTHGRATFFTEEMNTRLRKRVQMEQDLHAAIELGQLTLNFQPIFDTTGRRHRGAEVLLRWDHPERGSISPAEFIPLAEADGQIVDIGDWVLGQACRHWSGWRDSGIDSGFLAINISRIQFRRRLSARLAELMSIHGVPPEALELEITESVLMDDHSQVAEELSSLRAAGIKLSLDDFGTGFSSLSYLKRFRFDVLKIDRSFVAGVPNDADDVLLVKAILAMAQGFGLRVVAEGVETREQLNFLTAQGCDFAQGYYLGRPMTGEAYLAYLKNLQTGVEPLKLSASP